VAEPSGGLAEGYADVNGVRLHYVEAGDGPLLLFLHGFPQFWWLWRAQLAEFGSDRHAVAPDMRGFNLSSKPEGVESYRMRHLVEDVRAFAVEYLGVERFVLVGHDWGGIVSWAFAARHPELLDRLVILDAPPPFTWGRELERNPRQRAAARYMTDLSRPEPEPEELLMADDFRLLDGIVMEPGIQRGYLDEGDRERYHEAWGRDGAITAGLNYYRAAGMGAQVSSGQPAEARERLERIRIEVPTLVIWGEEDHMLLPDLTRGIEQWVPDVRVELVPGAGHWTPQERPERVNSLIREFLA
jgi:pimeloyl-ACP methyl ester carboxylesterase